VENKAVVLGKTQMAAVALAPRRPSLCPCSLRMLGVYSLDADVGAVLRRESSCLPGRPDQLVTI